MRPLEVDSLDFLLDGLHVWLTLSSMCLIAVEATVTIGRSLSTFFTSIHFINPFGGNGLKYRVRGLVIEHLPATSFDLLFVAN